MGNIRILEDHLVNKIAAGEVVERPSSVVKELVENSLDAGAQRIVVRLESGGRRLIEIEDDGAGMAPDDLLMCIERHGTSKIKTEEDLFSVATLGFRGEAIPSIGAVSRMGLISRPEDQELGYKVALNGGKLRPPEPVGCPAGTRITVRQLFFNLPVRRKFLRTVKTELSHCLECVTREALIRPDVDFTVEHDGKVLLRAPKAESRAERAAELLGGHGEALISADWSVGNLEVQALISPVGVHRGSSIGSQYLYVNGRYVRDATIQRAIREAYRSIVPKGRFPVVVLEVRVPWDHVDVNIHPTKTEVKFRFGRDLFAALSEGLREALFDHGIRRPVQEESRYITPEVPARPAPELPLVAAEPHTARPASGPTLASSPAPPAGTEPAPTTASTPEPFSTPSPMPPLGPSAAADALQTRRLKPLAGAPLLPVPRFQDLRVIGQFSRTYIVCEGGGELILVDQHAAHERITLYRYLQDFRGRLGGAQRLLAPIIVELTPARAAALSERLEVLDQIGLEVEDYGNHAFAVKAVPPNLKEKHIPDLVRDVADDLAQGGRGLNGRDLAEHVLATMACHNSIRANHTLSVYEMRELLKALDAVDYAVCAHGRPVIVRMDQRELERRFHRA